MQGLGLLVILFFFGLAGGIIGRIKGSSFFIWFLISFCIPFIGLLTAMLYRYDNRELRRQCPECGKVVKLHDAVCTRCGTELESFLTSRSPRRRRCDAGQPDLDLLVRCATVGAPGSSKPREKGNRCVQSTP